MSRLRCGVYARRLHAAHRSPSTSLCTDLYRVAASCVIHHVCPIPNKRCWVEIDMQWINEGPMDRNGMGDMLHIRVRVVAFLGLR